MAILTKERKIIIMGYRSVDKSSLSMQFVENTFEDSYNPTIENSFVKKTVLNNQHYKLKLVDTAGQDEYSIPIMQHFIDVHGYVLVYSITSLESFNIVQIIYNKLMYMTGQIHASVVLVGNKNDLHMDRVVSQEAGRRLANSWNAVYIETSAKQSNTDSKNSVTNLIHTVLNEIEKSNGNIQ